MVRLVRRRAVVAACAGCLLAAAALPAAAAPLLRAPLAVLEEVRVRLELEDEEGDVAAAAAAGKGRREEEPWEASGAGSRRGCDAHPGRSLAITKGKVARRLTRRA